MADARRLKRLEIAILETVAPLVAHGLADPRLQMVTVTRVHLSPDLSVAHVNWSALGGASAEATHHARDLSGLSGGDPLAPRLFSPPLFVTASPRFGVVRETGPLEMILFSTTLAARKLA